jgi:poly(A) polymerase
LLIRYRRSENGVPVAKAVVYTQAEHGIDRGSIDPDALRILERLRESGHEAYVVGGAVRDLLLGRKPKDFDIVTDAQPAKIKRVFRSARVIGRRFRLVHVYAGPKIFEVCTFRSIANGTVGNEFGTIDEDARRRDFTLNALYYDAYDSTLVDYVGGFKDIAAKRIEPVIPLASIFKEDPVRMIRCVKYAATAGFRIPLKLRFTLRRDAELLGGASPSRLTEEFLKILACGSSAPIVEALARYDLLRHLAPEAAALRSSDPAYAAALREAMAELDAHASDPTKERSLAMLLAIYLRPFLERDPELLSESPEAYRDAAHAARLFLSPLNPPRVELEAAVMMVFKRRGLSPTQRPRKPGQRSGSRSGPRQGREPTAQGETAPRREPQSRRVDSRAKGLEQRAREGEDRAIAEHRALPGAPESPPPTQQQAMPGDSPSAKRRRRRKRHGSRSADSRGPSAGA